MYEFLLHFIQQIVRAMQMVEFGLKSIKMAFDLGKSFTTA